MYSPDETVDNWRERVDRTKASYTLDKLEAERQLRTAKLNAVVVDTSAKLTELKANEPEKGAIPKLAKVAPLKDATKAGTTKTIFSDTQPDNDNKGAKPKSCSTKVEPKFTPVRLKPGSFYAPGEIPRNSGTPASESNNSDCPFVQRTTKERPWNIEPDPEPSSWIPWRKNASASKIF